MLFSMNQQVHGNTLEQEFFRSKGYLKPSPLEDQFTMFYFKLLEVSDNIMYNTRYGLFSAWSLLGLVGQLSYIESSFAEFSSELNASDPQFEVRVVQLDILQYTLHYLLLCVYIAFLEKYLHGDTSPHTRCYAANQHCKAFGWFFRGFGRYYAVVAEETLSRVKGDGDEMVGLREE
ncbi:hypothetical protein N7481_001536 [Penicillium waksmanii]|uniref:uncharacterized protein n=1 Tax=Penicillium waksmanii TaxID=69791 RepID=UPI0025482B59|nr:uncharacterized protein N7481_001536 [Penicillium waksmanii]KAJ6001127.1 hypothetical protein N7481_001536 [Penicillium waksmanii]